MYLIFVRRVGLDGTVLSGVCQSRCQMLQCRPPSRNQLTPSSATLAVTVSCHLSLSWSHWYAIQYPSLYPLGSLCPLILVWTGTDSGVGFGRRGPLESHCGRRKICQRHRCLVPPESFLQHLPGPPNTGSNSMLLDSVDEDCVQGY